MTSLWRPDSLYSSASDTAAGVVGSTPSTTSIAASRSPALWCSSAKASASTSRPKGKVTVTPDAIGTVTPLSALGEPSSRVCTNGWAPKSSPEATAQARSSRARAALPAAN